MLRTLFTKGRVRFHAPRWGTERRRRRKEERRKRGGELTLFSSVFECSQRSVIPQSRRERDWKVFDKVLAIMETEVEYDADQAQD